MDFWTLSPESAHQVTYLMGDRDIPKSWREMNGYTSLTDPLKDDEGDMGREAYPLRDDDEDGAQASILVARSATPAAQR